MSNKIDKLNEELKGWQVVSNSAENRMIEIESELAELSENQNEVKPVFPRDEQAFYHEIGSADEAGYIGISSETSQGRDKIYDWLIARAYVIEAINKANGGDNGFKSGEDNHFIIYSFTNEAVCWDVRECMQQMEGALYIRSSECAQELTKCEEFQANFKAMCGIK